MQNNAKYTSPKATVRLFMLAVFFNGFVMLVPQLHDIIARKALHASDWQITALVMIWPLSNFLSIWWGKLLERSSSKHRYFILVAVAGRLPLLLGLYLSGIYQFMGLLLILLAFNSLWMPTQSAMLQSNIGKSKRGRVFGWSVSITTFIAVVGNYLAGRLLDTDEAFFRQIFVVAGVCGVIGSLIMSIIRHKPGAIPIKKSPLTLKELFVSPMARTIALLKKDHHYARYELNFMIYGLGFIVIQPVIPGFLVDTMKLDYTQTFLAKGVLYQLGIFLFSPLAGKLHDHRHPSQFTRVLFLGLAGVPLLLILSSFVNKLHPAGILAGINLPMATVYLAYAFFGILMSGITISWNMGSMYFAGDEDAGMYQSVHVTLTGIRGLVAPLIGYTVKQLFGVNWVFGLSAAAFFSASLLSRHQYLNWLKSRQQKQLN